MNKVFAVAAVFYLLGCCVASQADVFNLGTGLTNLQTVAVGNPGNSADTRHPSSHFGSVSYTYSIGKYEVTAAQYCDFLNHKAKTDPYGLYNTAMGDPSGDASGAGSYGCNIQRSGASGDYTYSVASDWANRPVNYVSFWDACRFANWLANGQGDGDTENGAYALTTTGMNANTITRNSNWTWAVASEDEWYKAAYYDPSKPGGAGYWDYPTRSNTCPSCIGSDEYVDPGNHANYAVATGWSSYTYMIGAPYWRTNVGEFESSASAYGTFDQAGNVLEWNDTIYGGRTIRGGAFHESSTAFWAGSLSRNSYQPFAELPGFGFRVVQAVPESSSLLALFTGVSGLLCLRKRKR